MTYSDLIRSSLRLIGQLGPGRAPNGSEITDALFILNSMLEAWSIEHLMVYTVERAAYPLTGAGSYTIGPNGVFNVPRPVRIETAAYTYAGGPYEYPVEVMTDQRFQQGGGPTGLGDVGIYYDNKFPLATIYIRPPNTQATSLALYTWQQLRQVTDECKTVAFPPGYADAIRYNLAVRCCPEWGKMPRADVADMAIQSKANIKSFNMQPVVMDASDGGALACGCGCGSGYNIYTG